MRQLTMIGSFVLAIGIPAIAGAQTIDPDTRDEITSVRGDLGAGDIGQVGDSLSIVGGDHKPLTFAVSLNGRHTSNAGATSTDEDAARYIQPRIELGFQPIASGTAWSWGLIGRVENNLYDEDSETYNSGRAEFEAWTKATLAKVDLLAAYNVQGNYDSDFETRKYTINTYTVSFRTKAKDAGGKTNTWYFQADAARKASDRANSRRDQLTGVLRYTHPNEVWGLTLVGEERVIYSHYRGGTNKGRDDVLFRTAGTAKRVVGAWELGLNLVAATNTSSLNTADSFTFEVGPSISRKW